MQPCSGRASSTDQAVQSCWQAHWDEQEAERCAASPAGALLGGADMVGDGQAAGPPWASLRPQLVVQLLQRDDGALLPGVLQHVWQLRMAMVVGVSADENWYSVSVLCIVGCSFCLRPDCLRSSCSTSNSCLAWGAAVPAHIAHCMSTVQLNRVCK